MAPHAATDAAALGTHARDLAVAFDVRLIESATLKPHEALAIPHLRVVIASTIVEDTTYAVALHEIGHLAAVLGTLRSVVPTALDVPLASHLAHQHRLSVDEEIAAWTWARHYALTWTPAMQAVAAFGLGTYGVRLCETPEEAAAGPQPAPHADAPRPVRAPVVRGKIDWSAHRAK